MLRHEGRCSWILDDAQNIMKMVDDCGNSWDCVLTFGKTPYEHCKLSGEWKRFVEGRRICKGVRLRIGAPVDGPNQTIYVSVIPN